MRPTALQASSPAEPRNQRGTDCFRSRDVEAVDDGAGHEVQANEQDDVTRGGAVGLVLGVWLLGLGANYPPLTGTSLRCGARGG
jgi:hypothetical protein